MGVGKSSLVKQVLHRAKDRKIFLGGMLIVPARGINQIDELIDKLIQTLIKGI